MAKRNGEVQATEEVAAVEEVQATEEVAASSDASKKYVKTIPNPFDVRGHVIPDGEFGINELDLDEEQEQAFNHAISCGIIKEVE